MSGLRFPSFKALSETTVGRANLIKEPPKSEKAKGKSHTNAKKVTHDGIKFDSKLEGDYYLHLKLQQRAGIISHFHRQVIFDLGGVVAKIDFMIVFCDGRVPIIEYHDPKGRIMPSWTRNKKQIKQIYGIDVKEIFHGDF